MQLLDDLTTRECRAFAKAWQSWRGADLVPRRSAARIEDIHTLMPLISIIEVISPEVAKFRLAGTALCDAMGIELTGLNYFEFATPEERAVRAARTCELVAQPCGSHFLFPIAFKTGRTVPAEVLSLPVLPDDPSAPPQIFGISVLMEGLRLEETAAEPNQLPMVEGFQFVDIGAGVPDDALDLAKRPASTLLLKQAG